MTAHERIRAFALRCNGATWEEIAEIMHYDAHTISRDLRNVLEKRPHEPPILYPLIRRHVRREYAGSSERMAHAMHVSPHRLRQALLYGDAPDVLREKIMRELGLSDESAVFATEKEDEE